MIIKVTDHQTVFDIAMQYYGNIEAVAEILSLNPAICNELHREFEIDRPVMSGSDIAIDSSSLLMRPEVIREIKQDISLWQEP